MANYHLTVKMISRSGGKSCVSSLAYRSGTCLKDMRTGEVFDYTDKSFVGHVEILTPEGAPKWICDIAQECKNDKQSALQKLSDVFEAAERRNDSQVYREVELSLPNELTNEQNIKWATEFITEACVKKGMVAITNFHFDIDPKTGLNKPHCHVLLATRELAENGLSLHKNLGWNKHELVHEMREQYAAYQNLALKEHGFEVRVDHRSYDDRSIDIEGQPKLGSAILDMAKRGLNLEKLANFNAVKLRNQFKILKDPELVFSIVTSNHSTFTRQDIARVLNRYIDDADQFQTLQDRLLGSKNLVRLGTKEGEEPVYTTREMLGIEMGLVSRAERISAQHTHEVETAIIDRVIADQNHKLAEHKGLSADQDRAIRHMLGSEQISCVVGYAGAGKTTSLEAAKDAWEASGYKVIGLAPTGKAARNIEDCGIRAMTLHKFLYAQEHGREQISSKSVVVLDEAGMVDSRRFAELLAIVDKAGAKIVPMGDANQLQAIEAGPAFRLLTERLKPAVLETIVRQREDWQKDATRLFGSQQTEKALALYLEKGAVKIIKEKASQLGDVVEGGIDLGDKLEGAANSRQLIGNYCLARQMSGRIWKEMVADYERKDGKAELEQLDLGRFSGHQDYGLYKAWKDVRYKAVGALIYDFAAHRQELEARGVNIQDLGKLVEDYKVLTNDKDSVDKASGVLKEIDGTLRQMSYSHLVDTRQEAKKAMVEAWLHHRNAMPEKSHLMLAFTNKDTLSLNESARHFMRQAEVIKGQDFTYETQSIERDDFGKDIITKQDRSFAVGDRLLFTINNTGLGVKNGTLGTITFLDHNKIVATLDGKEAQEVSFAPKLYPYIDNGWATNIHKSQGVTVDHVKKLASFEEYRNLAYVGMSRHRETLEVYGSSLDFWREEKIIERLSRVQEKLSGFDYVSSDKLEEFIKEDAKVLWHEQKLQEGKDLWAAIKGTAKSAIDQLLDRPMDTIKIDPLDALENSEEKRSSRLFKETTAQTRHLNNADSSAIVSDSSSQDSFENKLKVVQEKIKDAYEVKTFTKEKFLSFEEVDKQLKERIYELATSILGEPNRGSRNSAYLRFGELNEFSVGVRGKHQGVYMNFVTGIKGGPLKLIEDQMGLSSSKDALKWASEWLGGNPLVIEHRVIERAQEIRQSTWTPITPVPKHVENPDIEGNKHLNYMLRDGAREVSRHAYRDELGNLKGYVFRIEKADGSKYTPPLAYCENEHGFKGWKWLAFEKENKTPYRIEILAQDLTKPILVVEGEKTCDAAQKLLPEYNVLTWSGGAGNVGKTNWEALAGKQVAIWPDNDSGGLKAADTLQKIVTSLNTKNGLQGSVGIVALPQSLPEKWDLADKLPEGWTLDTVKEMIRDAAYSKNMEPVHEQKISESVSDPQKADVNIEKAANQFIDLCVLYENMSWDDPNDSKTLRKIEAVAGKYMHNEEFRQRIEACGNEVVIEKLQTEMEEQKHLLKDNNASGLTNETTQSSEDTGAHIAATNIEKAANQFIDLCVLYENMSWDDPNDSKTLRKIEAVAGKYMHNEEFRQRIEASKNEIAIERFQNEVEEQKQNMSQNMSRGI